MCLAVMGKHKDLPTSCGGPHRCFMVKADAVPREDSPNLRTGKESLKAEKTFVKVVLTDKSTDSEWRQVIRLMQEGGPQIPLILQPSSACAHRLSSIVRAGYGSRRNLAKLGLRFST